MNTQELEQALPVLNLMIRCESEVGNFYRACAARWKKEADYWLGLAAEEDGHAGMVVRMRALIMAAPERYTAKRRLDTAYYRSFIDWLEANTEEVASGTSGENKAVETAQDIENVSYERKFQELFSTTDREYQALAAEIDAQTRRHYALVQAKSGKLIK